MTSTTSADPATWLAARWRRRGSTSRTRTAFVRSHVQATWLAETGQNLHGSLTELLDAGGDNPTLKLLPDVRTRLEDLGAAQRATARATSLG